MQKDINCNHRNFCMHKNLVLQRSRTFVRYKFSYCEGSVAYNGIHAWLLYATNFHTFSQKYKIYEIKSRTKISAITVGRQMVVRPLPINLGHTTD